MLSSQVAGAIIILLVATNAVLVAQLYASGRKLHGAFAENKKLNNNYWGAMEQLQNVKSELHDALAAKVADIPVREKGYPDEPFETKVVSRPHTYKTEVKRPVPPVKPRTREVHEYRAPATPASGTSHNSPHHCHTQNDTVSDVLMGMAIHEALTPAPEPYERPEAAAVYRVCDPSPAAEDHSYDRDDSPGDCGSSNDTSSYD